ncbi:MAG: MCE family protein [Deltaproteobacteria bacterium]|nr:MCE family protein [Deltaproteobacteria bacterium]MBW2667855.1 MCE family protein [Deltaproteobacteria bacterium]
MKNDQRNYAVVGVFVIAMVAGLILWIATLAGNTGSTDTYLTRYDSVLGLSAGGTQVYLNGFQIGKIESIERAEDGAEKMFLLEISVKSGWQIPDDSQAEITAAGLLSTNVLNIRRGRSKTNLEPGDEIQSLEASNLMAELTDTAAGFNRFLETTLKPQIETIVGDLRETMDQVNLLLSAENTGRVGTILRNLEDVSEEVQGLTSGLGSTREKLDGAIVKVGDLIDQVDQLIESNKDDLGASVTDLHESLEALSRHTEAIAINLESTMRHMNEFSQQIREDPSLILRRRESAGAPGGSK